jgi:hypothetical protein
LPFAYDLRLETAVTIAGHVNIDRADLGDHRLGASTVTTVAPVAALHGMLVVAEMIGHLRLQ